MTNTSTPSTSPGTGRTTTAPGTPSPSISPLHHPSQQAKVLPQQKPLGVAQMNHLPMGQEQSAGLGQKALLAKKFARANSKPTISPTDQMQSPCTQKLSEAKQRHYGKGKPASLAQSFVAIRDSSGASTNSAISQKENADF